MEDVQEYYDKVQNICEVWKRRRLALKAEVTVLNVLVFPILYYAASNRCFNVNMIKKVKQITTDFLWNGNSSKIAFETSTLPVIDGGMGLHDFELRVKADRIAWVKRIVTSKNGFWLDYLKHKFDKKICDRNFSEKEKTKFTEYSTVLPGCYS